MNGNERLIHSYSQLVFTDPLTVLEPCARQQRAGGQWENLQENSAFDKLIISVVFSSFAGALFCSFIWAIFVSSIWQPPCICFCVLRSGEGDELKGVHLQDLTTGR